MTDECVRLLPEISPFMADEVEFTWYRSCRRFLSTTTPKLLTADDTENCSDKNAPKAHDFTRCGAPNENRGHLGSRECLRLILPEEEISLLTQSVER